MSPYRKGTRTVGVSPKVAVPTSLLALAGAVLCGLDLAGVIALDDGVWIALLAAGGVTFGAGYRAGPGDVRGLTLVEVLVVLLIVLVVLMLVGALR